MALVNIAGRPMNDTSPQSMFPGAPTNELVGFLSYSYLCGAGSSSETRLIELPESRLKSLLKVVLGFVDVDEAWYLNTNPDVASAVKNGDLASGREHYIVAGFYEDRWPYLIAVDETWYQSEYPDVKTAIARGSVESAQDHFNRYGFVEGRLPSMGWSLLTRRPVHKGARQDK